MNRKAQTLTPPTCPPQVPAFAAPRTIAAARRASVSAVCATRRTASFAPAVRSSRRAGSAAAQRSSVVAAAETAKSNTIVDAAIADPQFSVLVEAVVKVCIPPPRRVEKKQLCCLFLGHELFGLPAAQRHPAPLPRARCDILRPSHARGDVETGVVRCRRGWTGLGVGVSWEQPPRCRLPRRALPGGTWSHALTATQLGVETRRGCQKALERGAHHRRHFSFRGGTVTTLSPCFLRPWEAETPHSHQV